MCERRSLRRNGRNYSTAWGLRSCRKSMFGSNYIRSLTKPKPDTPSVRGYHVVEKMTWKQEWKDMTLQSRESHSDSRAYGCYIVYGVGRKHLGTELGARIGSTSWGMSRW